MSDRKRLFIAIDLPDSVQLEVERCQIGIPTAKWVKKENLHLTLQFLGELSFEEFKILRHILSTVKGKSFYMVLKEPKVFFKKQKILWLKAEPEEVIINLRNNILKIIQKEKSQFNNLILKDKEKFLPHVTIARMNQVNQRKLNDYLLTFENFSTMEFKVDSFILFSSILKPEGAIYTREEIYKLD
ncbi:MAG: RNA 2',3'-cyclic phosphodiesterase [Leptospiraceae bacterium]|nr:MAG: RNA 2',3'-cyclic phosphodiesterase [Leptospiraceae bacterium]